MNKSFSELNQDSLSRIRNIWRKGLGSKVLLVILTLLLWPLTLIVLSGFIFDYYKSKNLTFAKLAVVGFLLLTLPVTLGWLNGVNGVFTGSKTKSEQQVKSSQPVPTSFSEPTQTPTPTPTPSPTPKPKLNLQADPQEYLEYSRELLSFFEDTNKFNTELGELLGKYPYLTTDEIIDLAKDTVILEKAYDRISGIGAPPELESAHQKYIQGYKLIKDSMPILREGLDNNDENLIKQVTAKMTAATKLVSKANDEVNLFTQSLKQ